MHYIIHELLKLCTPKNSLEYSLLSSRILTDILKKLISRIWHGKQAHGLRQYILYVYVVVLALPLWWINFIITGMLQPDGMFFSVRDILGLLSYLLKIFERLRKYCVFRHCFNYMGSVVWWKTDCEYSCLEMWAVIIVFKWFWRRNDSYSGGHTGGASGAVHQGPRPLGAHQRGPDSIFWKINFFCFSRCQSQWLLQRDRFLNRS